MAQLSTDTLVKAERIDKFVGADVARFEQPIRVRIARMRARLQRVGLGNVHNILKSGKGNLPDIDYSATEAAAITHDVLALYTRFFAEEDERNKAYRPDVIW